MKLQTLIGGICLSISCGTLVLGTHIAKAKPNSSTEVQIVLPEDVEWKNNLDIAGIQTATVIGNPGSAELYVLMSKMSSEAVLPTHTHPDDRLITVLSGVVYYGTGEFDPKNAKPYSAGAIIYIPAQTPHYLRARDEETVLQQTGVGPTEIDFLK